MWIMLLNAITRHCTMYVISFVKITDMAPIFNDVRVLCGFRAAWRAMVSVYKKEHVIVYAF